jgi:hypothetical protein
MHRNLNASPERSLSAPILTSSSWCTWALSSLETLELSLTGTNSHDSWKFSQPSRMVGLLYNPENSRRTNAVVAAAERRRIDGADSFSPHQSALTPLDHPNSMQSNVGLDRVHTIPAPPTSNSSSVSYKRGGQNMPSIGKGKQPQVVNQVISNEHARSMPTTPATTPPSSFAQLVPPDSERITNARVISERGLASSPIASPAPPPLTTCGPSHPSAQNSSHITTTYTVHGLSNFPILSLRSIRDRVNSPSPNQLSPPLQSHPQGPSPTSTTLSGKLSPTVSDTSSFDWTEDGQDPVLLQLISMSCSVLLHAYLKLARKTVPSGSEQHDVDGPKQTKDRVGRQQSSQSTTNSRKRKQNSSRDESDDGND